ncbi:Agd3-related carbohydrate-binding protein [Saccharothrix obliqua]|uniref:Agd3-related carbohydrate-binding protein n=1 Tax=Saccharothrix obliqua TaxID=2861747 RepID=UPI001C5E025E|nr:hypothetical protein [Saccharothrix obliqua]MBW4718084.1 hypothetical protein [Saccharothrix obliqua]
MRLSRFGSRARVPLLVVLALAIGVITATSPSIEDGAGGGRPAAVPLVVAAKRLVPVRVADQGPARRGDLVALRQLVIATGPDDFGLETWRSVLDRAGTPYDVLFAGAEQITADRLVRPDGVGRYNAILLTSNTLLRARPDGTYSSDVDTAQWNALWAYEREYGVRQVALNASPATEPEDYCLRPRGEVSVGDTPVPLAVTPAGRAVFDDLKPDASIPLTGSYLYRAGVAPGCAAETLLAAGDDAVAVAVRDPDGRERLALTFSTGVGSIPELLLSRGLLHWATRGVVLGEQRHWFSVDIDDWFNVTMRKYPDGGTGLYRLEARDAVAAAEAQDRLGERHPQAAGFKLNLPFNGSRLTADAPATCDDTGTPDSLSGCSKFLVDEFRWINHTATHPQMNNTPYQVNREEIQRNLEFAADAGLPVPPTVLKTPEYSGLGVYHRDGDGTGPPTDFGLTGSNQALLDAARDVGVRYVQGNMSFAAHRPPCVNCGIDHPLRREVFVVPDWPTSIAFEATDPEEQAILFNAEYGRSGSDPEHGDRDLTYDEIIDTEAEIAALHLMSGSAYAHTLHQGNVREYAPGRSLTFDWIEATVAKYAAYFAVPLKNPDWLTLAGYVEARTAHFAELAARQDAVWNRAAGTVAYTPTKNGALFLTGAATRPVTEADRKSADEAETYGSDAVARIGLTAGQRVVVQTEPAR